VLPHRSLERLGVELSRAVHVAPPVGGELQHSEPNQQLHREIHLVGRHVEHLGEETRIAPEFLGAHQPEQRMGQRILDDARRIQRHAGRGGGSLRVARVADEGADGLARQPQLLAELGHRLRRHLSLAPEKLRERGMVGAQRPGEGAQRIALVPGAAAGQLGPEHGGERRGSGGSGHARQEATRRPRPARVRLLKAGQPSCPGALCHCASPQGPIAVPPFRSHNHRANTTVGSNRPPGTSA
jgi:hypothetical protein